MKYEKATTEVIDFGKRISVIASSIEGSYANMSDFVHAHSEDGRCSNFGNTGDNSLFFCGNFYGNGPYTIIVNGQELTVTIESQGTDYYYTCSAYYGGGIPY